MKLSNRNMFDCISASQLCNALNRLKRLAHEDQKSIDKNTSTINHFHQISFNDQINDQRSFAQDSHSLSFKIYQERILQNKNNNICKGIKKITPVKDSNKSVMPNKQGLKESKENKKQEMKDTRSVTPRQIPINEKSIQILKEKQKKGDKYIPIYLRTQNQLKKKTQIMTKLKQQVRGKEEQIMKQCTFKPQVTTNMKKHASYYQESQNDIKLKSIRDMANSVEKIPRQPLKKINVQKQEKSVTPRKQVNRLKTYQNDVESKQNSVILPKETKVKATTAENAKKSNYKNKSFNVLLDMIQ